MGASNGGGAGIGGGYAGSDAGRVEIKNGTVIAKAGQQGGTRNRAIGPGRDNEKTAKFNNYYAAVPITLNYYLVEGLAIKAGVQPAFRVKTKLVADGMKMDLDDALDFLFSNKEVTVNKFDLMIPVGLSYEYKNIVLDARYNFGLIKVFKGLDVTSRNSLITLTLGYKL